ncbi:hypothetical protein PCL1606_59330 [Pseudomonas chlororaphis]|uniref:Uncharacterized protein n=1 Tax=Pseudomonas chlororaphis TaxID=587753 RepID=A0A0D5Y8K4_9PSED|nr:hypothetical protein PCL1606_59330 [Pseudomonas chlororaphis]
MCGDGRGTWRGYGHKSLPRKARPVARASIRNSRWSRVGSLSCGAPIGRQVRRETTL